jgi:hypothetical protein
VGDALPDVADGVEGTRADELHARRLAEQLGLGGERLERLMPLLIQHAEQERRATRELLEEAGWGASPADAGLRAAVLQRMDLSDSALRSQLSSDELRILEEFDAVQENTVLNLLANRQFEAWGNHFDFKDSEQAIFEAFHEQWREALHVARDASVTSAGLEAELSALQARLIGTLSGMLSKEDVAKMRILQEAANDPALGEPDSPH